jgi:protein SCO1/2
MTRLGFVVSALLVVCACRPAAINLPQYGEVPEFHLTDQNGQTFTGRSLVGKVWVADFFFSNCMGPCPRMTSRLHGVQEATKSLPDVEIASFTIDPANDTPTVLAGYSKEHGASARWRFLTGPQATLHNLCRNVFKLGDVDGSLTHSTKFVLIDRKMQIRGYYDSFDPESIQQLEADIKALERERS